MLSTTYFYEDEESFGDKIKDCKKEWLKFEKYKILKKTICSTKKENNQKRII